VQIWRLIVVVEDLAVDVELLADSPVMGDRVAGVDQSLVNQPHALEVMKLTGDVDLHRKSRSQRRKTASRRTSRVPSFMMSRSM
jgi:hypothetical protein